MRECAAGLIVEGQRILLGRRSAGRAFYPGVWDVFGGHLEPRETYEQALVRELNEELGITPTAWAHVATFSKPDPGGAGVGRYVFFLVTAWDASPLTANRTNTIASSGFRSTKRCGWIWRTHLRGRLARVLINKGTARAVTPAVSRHALRLSPRGRPNLTTTLSARERG